MFSSFFAEELFFFCWIAYELFIMFYICLHNIIQKYMFILKLHAEKFYMDKKVHFFIGAKSESW
jgi:hypothetical protein